jgi:hypothetical protein
MVEIATLGERLSALRLCDADALTAMRRSLERMLEDGRLVTSDDAFDRHGAWTAFGTECAACLERQERRGAQIADVEHEQVDLVEAEPILLDAGGDQREDLQVLDVSPSMASPRPQA